MRPAVSADVTELLVNWANGDVAARDEVIPQIYEELRRIARRHLRSERPDHTLQSAALVHEAFVRLTDKKLPDWQNRAHFFGVAAQMMRHILVDHARNRNASKRGGGVPRLLLDTHVAGLREPKQDLVALDDALKRLAGMDQQQAKIIELRFFGGLSIEETAEMTGISPATVKREWSTARAWLRREMSKDART